METVMEVMNKKVIQFDENSFIYKIGKELGKYDVGCAIITRNKKPVGIITERDVVKRVVAKNLNLKITKAKDVMTSPVQSLDQNTNIYYASKVMKDKKFQRYPVTKNGRIIGIITQANIIDYFTQQRKKFVIKHFSKKLRRFYL